ncbi:protein-ADP-ribose hydrolase [Cloacibacillus porcorum]|uniref:protein-ADP-ribose hydrolase n=1 Tax=Cloacibacillus porcorum TaxID=1197717 RepID=UPI002352BED4|nr:protein-ADP-ribose hydrolase [Cloacibacillus porcorum]MCI5863812.1 protein-ADP-ribose hydrolase [Cloacibacillus porcorum]MDD7650241.1 protein-ADP-ribose hydrolase [Cloacibacillus porcorum]MDY4092282.1 protein-ADP-ribose hydrolase [Cloacibacillus porcorum]
MTQEERLDYLIRTLAAEQPRYAGLELPADRGEKRALLRALFNLRPPLPADERLLSVQDEYLAEELRARGTTLAAELAPLSGDICLWQGDITTLAADAVVNAANSAMLGCFVPCHRCIDNAIHTYAGIQLRLACHELMERQGHEEPTGGAKITPAFNLPSRYVIHTVGPIVYASLTRRERDELASCYRSCLKLAKENGLKSIAFCCISTGEFRFPNAAAAQIAVDTVREFLKEEGVGMRVIFNVFKDIDREIYAGLLR